MPEEVVLGVKMFPLLPAATVTTRTIFENVILPSQLLALLFWINKSSFLSGCRVLEVNLALSLSEEAAARLFKVTAGAGKILVLLKLMDFFFSDSIPPAATGNRGLWRKLFYAAVKGGQFQTEKNHHFIKPLKVAWRQFFFFFFLAQVMGCKAA